jgi:hypothetical protein
MRTISRGLGLLFLSVLVAGCVTGATAVAEPTAFVGEWVGEWFSHTDPGRGPLKVMIGPHQYGAYPLTARFANAPVATLRGEANYVNGRLLLEDGTVTVTITPKSDGGLAGVEWSYGASTRSWALRRAD